MTAKHPVRIALIGMATAGAVMLGMTVPASAQAKTDQVVSDGAATRRWLSSAARSSRVFLATT